MKMIFILHFLLELSHFSIGQADTSVTFKNCGRGFSMDHALYNYSDHFEDGNSVCINVDLPRYTAFVFALDRISKDLVYRGFYYCDPIPKNITTMGRAGDIDTFKPSVCYYFLRTGWWTYYKRGKKIKRVRFEKDVEVEVKHYKH